MTERHFTAAKAFLVHQDKVLLLRESAAYQDGLQTGCYDVPGGRLDDGETLQDGLTREVREETGLSFSSAELFFDDCITIAAKNGETWHIHRHYFVCQADSTDVVTGTDHDAHIWISPSDYKTLTPVSNLPDVFKAYIDSTRR